MSKNLLNDFNLNRSGASQAERKLRALAEDYVRIDERSVEDLLRFVQKMGPELIYYNLRNEPEGDWSSFLGQDPAFIRELAVYLDNPEAFEQDEEKLVRLARPHVVLLLVFIQLLKEYSQPLLNAFTRRHLDYYFKDILRFTPRPARPDEVHLLAELAPGFKQNRYLLSADTLLDAGKDEDGNPLCYQPEAPLMVNRAQVADIRSVYVARSAERLSSYRITKNLLPMLRLALGEDEAGELAPGAELPSVGPPHTLFLGRSAAPDKSFLKEEVLPFLHAGVFYGQPGPAPEHHLNFALLRKLIRLKEQREHDLNEWRQLNELLKKLKEGGSASFDAPREFETNFRAATGIGPNDPEAFKELQNVNTVYELYEELEAVWEAAEEDPMGMNKKRGLIAFVQEQFFGNTGEEPENMETFRAMMRIRMATLNEWREIVELLEATSPGATLAPDFESPNLDALLHEAYGLSATILSQYYDETLRIEQYFALAAEEVLALLAAAFQRSIEQGPELSEEEIQALLARAHQDKERVKRQEALRARREESGFFGLLQEALGSPGPGDSLPANMALENLEHLYNLSFGGIPFDGLGYIEQQLHLSLDDFRFIMEVHRDEKATPEGADRPPGGAPPWKWRRVYDLLERAERAMRRISTPPPPEAVVLKGIHRADDATSITAGDEQAATPRWRTFGNAKMGPAQLGLAVSSPLLALSGGERKITMYLHLTGLTNEIKPELRGLLRGEGVAAYTAPAFIIEVSGEKDWMELDEDDLFFDFIPDDADNIIKISADIPADADPVMPLPRGAGSRITDEPALRLRLRYPDQYEVFSQLNIRKIELSVVVEGLLPTHIRNDRAILKPGEPFEPFGHHPRPGSRLAFTHPEIAAKKLDSLTLNVQWKGEPDFEKVYENYAIDDGQRKIKGKFNASLLLMDQGMVRRFAEEEGGIEKSILLFPNDNVDDNYTVDFNFPFPADGGESSIYESLPGAVLTVDVLHSGRYFSLELGAPDFGHDEYPGLAAEKASLLAIDIAREDIDADTDTSDYKVNPPYTPEIGAFSITYHAHIDNILASDTAGYARAYHLHPFGYKALKGKSDTLLPRYLNEGELYLGLKGLEPPADVSLLFQMAEGSANPGLPPPPVAWKYLKGDEWMPADILQDSTGNLLNSGIIRFRISAEADDQHLLLPSGLHWLRASVRENSHGVCDIVGIHSQAFSARLAGPAAAFGHFQQPLPAGSITRLIRRQPAIKAIHQPYSSFGGRIEEPAEAFYTRVSERLRHKNRALSPWDYERLVLKHFPQVYRAKCLPGGYPVSDEPGRVDLIVVPDIRGMEPFDPFEPKLPVNVLRDIEAFLRNRAPETARIEVRNPRYHQLLIRMGVQLHSEYQADAAYYLHKLQESLLRLLAPWAYDEGAELVVGGRVHPSLIIDFVEQQPYIDYILDFNLLYENERQELRPASAAQIQKGLEIPRPDAIWVSARKHRLDTWKEAAAQGVGYMQVELDLIVG